MGVVNRMELHSNAFYSVSSISLHPDYNLSNPNTAADVALFKLAVKIPRNHQHIQPICLPTSESFVEPKMATVAGWGFQYSDCMTSFWYEVILVEAKVEPF